MYIFPIVQIANVIFTFITENPYMLLPIRLSAVFQIAVFFVLGIILWLRDRRRYQYLYYSLSWIPFGAGSALVVLWLSGKVGQNPLYAWGIPFGTLCQSVLLSFAAGQQLKVFVALLQKRDSAITSFVSKGILHELEEGSDPLAFSPQLVTKSIVFIDMRDYSKFSEDLPVQDCYSIMNEYFNAINSSIYDGGGEVNKIIGDAVMCSFDNEIACLNSVLDLRFRLSEMNRRRVDANQTPYKFGTGIAHGTMLIGNFGTSQKIDRTLVGDTVNIASRIEGLTKEFFVDILCSNEFYERNKDYPYVRPAGYAQLKGKEKKVLIYEIFGHNKPEVVEWKLSTIKTLNEVVELELAGKYGASIRLVEELIKKCPPHGYKNNEIMDPTLKAIIQAIMVKVKANDLSLD
jgi:class 3 adenylate cyclase